jgi:hypothetical protein
MPGVIFIPENNLSNEIGARFWAATVGFVLIGYLCMTRSFAYLGIRPINVFIGEVILGLFLLTKAGFIIVKWLGSLVVDVILSPFAWVYYLFLGYGVIQVLLGISSGFSLVTALQILIFNIYPLYIFIGIYLGDRYPNYLGKFLRLLAWCNGIYGVIYIAILNPMFWDASIVSDQTGEQIALFGQPSGSAPAILGLLCCESKFRKKVLPLFLNAFVMLALQVRSEWLGFAVGFVVWGMISRKLGGMLAGAGAIVVLLGAGYLIDFSIPAPVGRGGQISTLDIVGRGLAAFDPENASNFSRTAGSAAGTVEWRTKWWTAIWDSTHETNSRALFGHGYGFPITALVTYLADHHRDRSPHNVFFFCLAYGGWVGVVLFFVFQLTILRLHWLTYKLTKAPFGIAYLAMCLSSASFGNFFETPFGAIPYYLITGLAIAPSVWVSAKLNLRENAKHAK